MNRNAQEVEQMCVTALQIRASGHSIASLPAKMTRVELQPSTTSSVDLQQGYIAYCAVGCVQASL